jgi:radical SAM superfamily enzyme YgiQ (UPF0313 family)
MSWNFREHLGAAFLRAILWQAGFCSRAYLPPSTPSLAGFAAELRESRPVLLGFTVYETNLLATRALIRTARQALPGAFILAGGPNATFSPLETLHWTGADACLRGAGEGVIVPILQALLGQSEWTNALAGIPNLVLATPEGPLSTPRASLSSFPEGHCRELDDLPSPYQAGLVSTTGIGYLTARGCNQNCTYCSFATLSERRVKIHGIQRVLDDLDAYQALVERCGHPPARVPIFDDAFTLFPERARRICEGLIERDIRLPLNCQTRADRVDADLLRLMRRAGFVSVAFGLESGVPRILRTIGKVRPPETTGDPAWEAEKDFLEAMREAVAHARDAGLDVSVSIMGGLPAETREDFEATLRFVESLEVETYAHNLLSLMPGTPLYETRARFGLEAGRDMETGQWWTRHAYPASAVQPLPHADTRDGGWREAQGLADALCGRPRVGESGAGVPWAAVIHGLEPTPALLAWLGETLAIGCTLVVLAGDGTSPSSRAWRVAHALGPLVAGKIFVRERDPQGWARFRAVGSPCVHQADLLEAWDPARAVTPVALDPFGNARFPLWVAAGPPDASLEAEIPTLGPGLQVADPCRAWPRGRRCRTPRVLHLRADGSIAPCWHGPAVGHVGDSMTSIRAACEALAPDDACPLAGPEERWPAGLEDLDLASQLTWHFPPTRGPRADW